MRIMENKAIRIECFQNLVNYRKPSSFIIKETLPLPPFSTVLGMIHSACGFNEFHNMKLCIQGMNNGFISELYTRYSFNAGAKYEPDRHQLYVGDEKKYGIFKGIANVELICENSMVIHIMPEESDFDIVYNSLMFPPKYLSLGRHEDLLDIRDIQKVKIYEQEEVPLKRNMYIPVDSKYTFDMNIAGNSPCTIYNLTKEYEITKDGLRRWKKDGGRIKCYYMPAGRCLEMAYVDDYGDDAAIIFV